MLWLAIFSTLAAAGFGYWLRGRGEARWRARQEDLERLVAARTVELARFAAIADATTDFWGFAGMDEQSHYINAAWRRVIGLPPAGPLDGVMVEHLYTPESYRILKETAIPSALRDGTWTGELKVRGHDGSEVPVSMAGLIVRDENGQPSYMAGVMRDISDRKQLEAELKRGLAREKELSDLKSSFVSMVSHEFRTPLGIIGSSAQILDRYFARLDADERREHLDNITVSVKRMACMMEDVLVLSRVDSGRMEFRPAPLALGELCHRLLDELRSAHGGTVELRVAPAAEAPAEADENLLRHILTNLLTNAHKYSPPGAPVHLALARENGDAVFTVRDEGIGIPEADQAHLFEAFHRGGNVGHVGGTGLGLVIVRRCCELHGGSVSSASREGAGTTFTVRLPVFKTT